ncbi:MAG TPA: hypothetical protein VFZ77_11085 [Acidimicrobiales bacterium]
MKMLINGLLSEAELLMIAAFIGLTLWSTLATYFRTRSWGPTIGAFATGILVSWAVTQTTNFRTGVGNDMAPYVVQGATTTTTR